MSSQAVVLQPGAVQQDRARSAAAGAWRLSGAMLATGFLVYAFHVLAARSLGPHRYGQIAVLWAAVFLGAIVLFRPLEQATARTVADRLARGQEVVTVVRSVALVAAATLALVLLAAAVGWAAITRQLFLGNDLLTAMLVGGIAAYGIAYFLRGLLGGVRWFNGYALALGADAVSRLAVAAPLVFFASQAIAASAVVAAGVGGTIAPLYLGRARLRAHLGGLPGAHFRPAAALAFAAPAGAIAAADQLLVNGGPLLVMVDGAGHASSTAGVVFAATMLVRGPVYVFQGVAASLLPNLTRLHAEDKLVRLRHAVLQTAGFLLLAGALIVGFAVVVGPGAMTLLYGSGFAAGRLQLGLLGAGVGCYLAASTLSQALLALDCGGRAAVAWTSAAALFVGAYALLPGAQLTRIALSFLAASAADLVVLGVAFAGKVGRP